MPQARLPDVNTSFIKWRNKMATALEAGKYTASIGSVNAFNACLPKEYQVKVSNELYAQELEKAGLSVHCKKCDQDVKYKLVKRIKVLCDDLERMITGSSYKQVWVCPLCGTDHLVSNSEFIEDKLPNPYYIGVVPDPPQRKDGILDRHSYHKKIETWIWTIIGELENRAAQFRDDSWQKAMNAGYDILAGGEEDDKD